MNLILSLSGISFGRYCRKRGGYCRKRGYCKSGGFEKKINRGGGGDGHIGGVVYRRGSSLIHQVSDLGFKNGVI